MITEFLHCEDERSTWAAIYGKGGEPLLRQWSKHAHGLGKDWIEEEGLEYHHGLRLCLALNFIGANDDEVLSLIHMVPMHCRVIHFNNPNTGIKVIEALWHGHYRSRSGEETPDVGAMTAFMNFHELALHVFRTRRDLAEKLSPFVYNLFLFAVHREDRQAS